MFPEKFISTVSVDTKSIPPELNSASITLFDAASLTVLCGALVTIIKMVGPSIWKVFKQRNESYLESASTDLRIEEQQAASLLKSLDVHQSVILESHTKLTDVLIHKVTDAIEKLTDTQNQMAHQVESMATTQSKISGTLLEVAKLLRTMERDINNGKSDHGHPGRRSSDHSTSEGRRFTDLPQNDLGDM